MNRRPGVTLIEVLAAIFIMAIGSLALLTLFPLGALTMGQALKDDRCINCVQCANGIANAFNLRQDPGATAAMMVDSGGNALPAGFTGPSSPVYIDPYYATVSNNLAGIARINPTTTTATPPGNWPATAPLGPQYFSLLDDITYLNNGTPDVSSGNVNRGGVYTWAYRLQIPNVSLPQQVDMAVVVYRGRPTAIPVLESTYQYTLGNAPTLAGSTGGSNTIVITYNPQAKPPVRRGGWILDNSVYMYGTVNIQNAAFYRVVNVIDNIQANQMTLELQVPLSTPAGNPNVTSVVFMANVQEVFDRSVSR